MKKILTVIIIGLLCLSTLSILIPKVKAEGTYTDFESGFGGWQPSSRGEGIVQISTMYSHSGSHSLEQWCPPGGTGGTPPFSEASVTFPATTFLSQYELSLWVYVTERKYEAAASQFGFLFNNEWVLWDVWGPGPRGSYVYVRESEGYQRLGDYYNPIPYGLSPDIWHHVKVIAYGTFGTISVWLDGNLIVDNWPAFNAGEKPDYYYIHAHANYPEDYVRHFVDDVYISEVGPLLVGYWKFDEGIGNIAYDSSGNNFDGTVYGASWVDGISNKALQFDGVDDYVEVSSNPSLSGFTQLTLGAWIKVDTLSMVKGYVVAKSDGWAHPNPNDEYGLFIAGHTVNFHVADGRLGYLVFGTADVINEVGMWYFLAATWSGSTYAIYVDGNMVSTGNAVLGISSIGSAPLTMGQIGHWSWTYFDGAIDEVKVYNYARTPEEIWSDYMLRAVGYWKFDEGAGNIAFDSSGNNNHGTAYGASWTDGVSGKALDFNGVDNWVSVQSSSMLSGVSQLTLQAWIKVDSLSPSDEVRQVVGKTSGTPQYYDEYGLQIAAGRIRFYVSNETMNLFFRDTAEIITVGRWYFVAGTWDGANYAIYFNGQIAASGVSYPGKSQTTVTPVEIGKIDGWPWTYFDGIIDEVVIYNYARTPEQIWNDYTSVNQPPVADFRFRGPETSFTPSTIYVGSEVKFDAEPSYDPDGIIASYTWNFGEGTIVTETDRVAYHVYPISGPYAVTLTVTDDKGATNEISKDIFINPLRWEIYFEIDYMTGHAPTDAVLGYIHGHFRDNGIYVYFFVDDEISPADPSVTESEFWAYELQYNDAVVYDDRGFGNKANGKYTLKEKWVLFGTVSAESTTASGYSFGDTSAGNYIFIADQANDQWASPRPVSADEVETVALMHEIGHTIGISLRDKPGTDPDGDGTPEDYDNTPWSVMALLSVSNCIADPIRYSPRYWKEKNLEYYII